MNAREMVVASFKQSQGYLSRSLEGLTQEDIAWRPNRECNSIAFILWHATRVEDFFVTRVIQRRTEIYEAEGWQGKLGTAARETGFGYTVEQIKTWPVPRLEDLIGYFNDVRSSTMAFLEQLPPERMLELARPERPPATLGSILSRVSTEVAMHTGQIDYLRGMRRGFVSTGVPGD
jgi:hypothetical protein